MTTSVAVVAPVFRNAATLPALVGRAARAVPGATIVLVDDACPDGSGDVAAALAAEHDHVVALRHATNRGQQEAVRSGLRRVPADVHVVLDADLQDPPEAIPLLLEELARGNAEAVFAGRRGAYEGPLRRLGGVAHRRVLAWTLGLPSDAGGFVAMTGRCTRAVLAMDGPPQLVAMIGRTGYPTASIPVRRDGRDVGSSTVGTGARFRHAAAGLRHVVLAARDTQTRPDPDQGVRR